MEVIGKSHGQVILDSGLDRVYPFFADPKKLLSFNPFCKEVSPTELENVYRWDFEIMDPQSHPIHLIFFVEQIEHPWPDFSGGQIFWKDYPVIIEGEMPDDHTFIGKAHGEMLLKPLSLYQTFVDVSMKIHVNFAVPILLKFFPEPVIKLMSETAMSLGMQHVSRRMLDRIRQEFRCTVLDSTDFGSATVHD